MYCKQCLNQLLEKMTDNDIIILENLLNNNANIPQCALSYKKVNDNFKDNKEITEHVIYMSLKRLNILGFVDTQKWSRKLKYYITDDGINLLNLIKNKIK